MSERQVADRGSEAYRSGATLWPLHAASILVALCGIGAVSVTVDGLPYTHLWVVLILAGHLTSFLLRRARLDPMVVIVPVVGVACIWMVAGLPAYHRSLGIERLPPDMELAITLAWLEVIRSFSVVNNPSFLFSAVPTLAMLGLMGSNNPNLEMPIFFGLFAFGTIFMVVYEQHLRRVATVQAAPRPASWHLVTTASIFGLCLLGGTLFVLLASPLLGAVSPYALPMLARNQLARTFSAATRSIVNTVPIGSGPIALSPTPVLDVYTRAGSPLLLRTAVLTDYAGTGWLMPPRMYGISHMSTEKVDPEIPPGAGASASSSWYVHRLPADRDLPADPALRKQSGVRINSVDQTILVRASLSPLLPAVVRAREVRYQNSRLSVQPSGTMFGPAYFEPGMVFRVTSEAVEIDPEALRRTPASDPTSFELQPALATPVGATRLNALAAEITSGLTNDYDKIQAIIQHIERTCPYTLAEEPTPVGQDAVEYYLFNSRKGACDLAASAAAMLCRAAGVPARVAIGYMADVGLPNGDGYLVRQSDAHMWFEAYFSGCGWVAFNPAPQASDLQDTGVSGWLNDAGRRLRRLFGTGMDRYLLLLVLLAVAISAFQVVGRPIWQAYLARIGRGRRLDRLAPARLAYRDMLHILARRGWTRRPDMTPLEFRRWLARAWGSESPALEPVDRLTRAFQETFYGRDGLSPVEDAGLRGDLRRLRETAPRAPRRARTDRAPAVEAAAG